ncbi:MAG: hypothetical protein ABR507_07130 [Actinomycetota bacterium]
MDVGKFDELIEQAEGSNGIEIPQEATDLLTFARELKSFKLPDPAFSVEIEDRIFAKLAAAEPELAPEAADQMAAAEIADPALGLIADKLTKLEPATLSSEVEDRIFDKIQSQVAAFEPAKHSKVAAIRDSVAAALPSLVLQRRADAFAGMLDDLAAGKVIAASGASKKMLQLAYNMTPVPATGPSESFVDWLEVRIMSNSSQVAVQESESSLNRIGGLFRSGKFQAGIAGATALLALAAGLTLRPGDVQTQKPSTHQPVPVASAPVEPVDSGPSVPPAVVATSAQGTSKKAPVSGKKSSTDSKKDFTAPGGTDNGNGGDGSSDPTGATFAAEAGNTIIERTLDSIGGK